MIRDPTRAAETIRAVMELAAPTATHIDIPLPGLSICRLVCVCFSQFADDICSLVVRVCGLPLDGEEQIVLSTGWMFNRQLAAGMLDSTRFLIWQCDMF
jgi:hypothetical protein